MTDFFRIALRSSSNFPTRLPSIFLPLCISWIVQLMFSCEQPSSWSERKSNWHRERNQWSGKPVKYLLIHRSSLKSSIVWFSGDQINCGTVPKQSKLVSLENGVDLDKLLQRRSMHDTEANKVFFIPEISYYLQSTHFLFLGPRNSCSKAFRCSGAARKGRDFCHWMHVGEGCESC